MILFFLVIRLASRNNIIIVTSFIICKVARLLFPGQLCLLLCACACEFGFGVRVSTIKRSKSNYLVNIFVSHRVVPYDDKNSRRFISDSIDHLILSYSTWRSFARNASARTTIRLSCHKVKLRSSRDIQPCFTMSSQVMLISNLNLSLDFENPKHSGF